MRTLFVSLLFIFSGFTGVYEKAGEETYTIEPGTGTGEIKIGMSYKDFLIVAGTPYEHRPFKAEKKAFKKYKYDTSKMIPFRIGFDYVLIYTEKNNKSPYPIFKAYFKADKLIYFALSSYSYDK